MDMLKVIFEQMEMTNEWKSICKSIDDKIIRSISKVRNANIELENEKIRDEIFDIVRIAEREAFVKGFKYAVKLLNECMKTY